jgi:hypothetical protein
MASHSGSHIKETDSYYVLRHNPSGLYVHELDFDWGHYSLEEASLLDNTDNQLSFGPMRIYPIMGGRAVSALATPSGSESDVAQQLDHEGRRVIDWLNENDHYFPGAEAKCDYAYSDFELILVEVEYTARRVQPVSGNLGHE